MKERNLRVQIILILHVWMRSFQMRQERIIERRQKLEVDVTCGRSRVGAELCKQQLQDVDRLKKKPSLLWFRMRWGTSPNTIVYHAIEKNETSMWRPRSGNEKWAGKFFGKIKDSRKQMVSGHLHATWKGKLAFPSQFAAVTWITCFYITPSLEFFSELELNKI